jgi:glycogen synthase
VFASREFWPFVEGGGIGRCVWAAARLLAPHFDVSVVTSERWRSTYEALAGAADPRLPPGVRLEFAAEPEGDLSPFVSWHQAWSEQLLRHTAALHPGGGPDIVETADYQGEGFAFAHAIRGHDPRVRRTTLVMRLSTSAEMCAVLNEDPPDSAFDVLRGIERFPLRFADVLLWPGGDSLDHYREFYGEDGLARAVRCPLPTGDELPASTQGKEPPPQGPLRLLYLNRLERRKGIAELIAAFRALPASDVRLTVVGRDTPTGPGGTSMRAHAQALARGDNRITFKEQVPHTQVTELIASHDVVVVPSRWETFSYVTREALAANRPVLATPSGGIIDVVLPNRSGWLAESSSVEHLEAALRELLDARDTVPKLIQQSAPRAVFEQSATDDEQLAVYEAIFKQARSRAIEERPAPGARVTAIIVLDGSGTGLGHTLRSLERQDHVELQSVLVLRSGQRTPVPDELARVARVVARVSATGRPAAWAEGLDFSATDAVLLVPSGTVIDSAFVSRALAILRDEEQIAYVTAFADFGSLPWHAPFGNYQLPVDDIDGGGSVAVFRRSALQDLLATADATPADEAALYAQLGRRGAIGLVLHEPLVKRLPRRLRAA